MQLLGVFIVFCSSQILMTMATLSEFLSPLQTMYKWTHPDGQKKVNRFGLEKADPVQRRPEVGYFTPGAVGSIVGPKVVELKKDEQGRPVLVLEDIVKTSSTKKPSVIVTPAKSSSTQSSSSKTSVSSSDDSISVTSASPTTSVTSEPSSETNSFHMIDLKIPGGESPDSENLPDVAIFRPLENKKPESLLTTENENLSSSSTVAPTTTTAAIAVTVTSVDSAASSSRSTTEESARQSDRFVQTIRGPVQSRVVQDVNELFQSED